MSKVASFSWDSFAPPLVSDNQLQKQSSANPFGAWLPALSGKQLQKSSQEFVTERVQLLISSIQVLSPTLLKINFNRPATDNVPLRTPQNYVTSPVLSTFDVQPENVAEPTYVLLTTSEMKQGQIYSMLIVVVQAAGAVLITGTFTGVGGLPTIASVRALTRNRIRATFSESMTNNAALLLPANYSITPDMGSTARTVTSVIAYSSPAYYVDLVLSGDMTPGTDNYNVAVSTAGPTDVAGNTMDPAGNNGDASGPAAIGAVLAHTDGGDEITISGLVVDDGTYTIHVGPLGSTGDPTMTSGVLGSAESVEVANGSFTAFAPPLPIGGPYIFTLVDSTGATFPTDAILSVVPFEFRSGTMRVRTLLPDRFYVGPRRVDQPGEQS